MRPGRIPGLTKACAGSRALTRTLLKYIINCILNTNTTLQVLAFIIHTFGTALERWRTDILLPEGRECCGYASSLRPFFYLLLCKSVFFSGVPCLGSRARPYCRDSTSSRLLYLHRVHTSMCSCVDLANSVFPAQCSEPLAMESGLCEECGNVAANNGIYDEHGNKGDTNPQESKRITAMSAAACGALSFFSSAPPPRLACRWCPAPGPRHPV